MMLSARSCLLLAWAAGIAEVGGVQRSAGAGAWSGAGLANKTGPEIGGGAGLVGEFGKRGFRMLGKSCWDNDVWRADFHLTRAMCAKTRSHRAVGRASERVIRKLHEGKCITMVVLGASTTFANCYGCWKSVLPQQYKRAWPGQLKKWLDTMFPCDDVGGHQVTNFAESAADANYWKMQAHVWKANESHVLNQADIVFTETAVTDAECRMDPSPPMLIMPPQNARLIQADNELLIRVLKTLPKQPWVIMSEVSWRYDKQRYTGDVHWDAVLTHLPIAQHYDVDQVSILDAFLPLSDNKLRWLQAYFFVDNAHAGPFGQQLIAQVMAHTIMEESHHMNSPEAESDFDNNETLPDPQWMDKDLALMYDRVKPYSLIQGKDPNHYPFESVFGRTFFEWNGHQIVATDLPPEGPWPTLNFWVNLTLSETEDTRPGRRGYVNLGLRRLKQEGQCAIYYAVDTQPCGPQVGAEKFQVGMEVRPYWPIPSSLRYNEGFWFDLPNATEVPKACLLMLLQWHGAPGTDPWQFLVDDLTVLA